MQVGAIRKGGGTPPSGNLPSYNAGLGIGLALEAVGEPGRGGQVRLAPPLILGALMGVELAGYLGLVSDAARDTAKLGAGGRPPDYGPAAHRACKPPGLVSHRGSPSAAARGASLVHAGVEHIEVP